MIKMRATTLGNEVDFLTGFPFPSESYSSDECDIKLLRGDNIGQGSLRWNDAKKFPVGEREEYEDFELQVDDVVLAMDRPWVDAGLKYTALSKDDLPCLLVQRTARMRGREGLNTKYLKYIIGSPWFTIYIKRITTGSLVPHISSRQIKEFPLQLPPVSEQKKIADVLSSIDQKIEINNRINTELEAMAKTLYDYWFVQFDFPDENGKPYKSSGGKMVYSKELKREIPAGWEVFNLNKLVDLIKGNVSPSEVDINIPYVGLEHISRKSIVLSTWSTSENISSEKTKFKKNDILFGKIRPYFHKVAAALFDGITSTDTIVLRAKQVNYYGLALETVFSEKFIEAATQGSTGSKMPRADWNILQSYKVVIPSNNLLEAYQTIFDTALRKIELSVMENQQLAALRDWLLPILMNGQVQVTENQQTLKTTEIPYSTDNSRA